MKYISFKLEITAFDHKVFDLLISLPYNIYLAFNANIFKTKSFF